MHPPTNRHSMYHGAQYLFFIPFSTDPLRSRKRSDHTKRNSTKTKASSVQLYRSSKFGKVTHSMRFSRSRYSRTIVEVSIKVCCLSEEGPCLVRKREEVIVEPECIDSSNEALNPAPSTARFNSTPSPRTWSAILDAGAPISPSNRKNEGRETYNVLPNVRTTSSS